ALIPAAGMAQLPAGGTEGLLTAGVESDPSMLRRQIANSLRNNPEQAKQLFASWIDEKGN
ncbi:MAG: hypothetical protein PHQ00_06195, partial [Phycisphaerae bacterium]|nr:hypothetical protein [Phycisphaerae bacterium]